MMDFVLKMGGVLHWHPQNTPNDPDLREKQAKFSPQYTQINEMYAKYGGFYNKSDGFHTN